MIPFERRDEDSLVDMLAIAGLRAMDDAGLGDRPVDAVYVGNMASGLFNHQVSVASSLVDRLNLMPAAADRIENGPASGGSAVKNGLLAVASGYYDVVLVVGGEKMREVIGPKATDIVACMTHPTAEYIYGVTLPAMAGMFTRLYMDKYGITRDHLADVSIKNQNNGLLNPYAHIQMKITKEGILTHPQAHINNPVVADPLHLYDCCPVSDGAAAGFFKKGEGGEAVSSGATQIGGKLPINPSGGLKARGHPVGATGTAQIVELVWQLRGEAHERQVKDAANGFSVNFGGFGNNVLAFVLRREA
jgi:acetyl-CoA C-acetyltransferase